MSKVPVREVLRYLGGFDRIDKFTYSEGGKWYDYIEACDDGDISLYYLETLIHSVRSILGREWDAINGWRI